MDRVWEQFIENERKKPYFIKLEDKLANEYKSYTVYPPKKEIYNAFELTPPDKIKCVIIGQDPYINKGEAHGLAFSVTENCKMPPSLKNIFKELEDDLGIKRDSTYLINWAKEGVLLINRVLTVRAGESNSHKNFGWMEFTKSVIEFISDNYSNIVFMLWGGEARKLKSIINSSHLILEAPHPSPLSSYRGFFGCKHFSMCNNYLKETGRGEIKWEN